ncbi:Protein of unknown function [Lactobacillus gigeriorum DSM 23908 = CRBIP 24.85]|uniref:Uncharacterized protein n=1 Tax=Lactobacillus gigeriorum DSM 23908 = CRBIP 24.85 TaxID=1423751 RepID=I7KNZ1_9LACO|nr:Protein of unknown function [Lactobacillus gigeriorum DSM 23908 = CRBIP 24.85]CCI87004.1 Protein of unknown function [Lactobacillus gigeriorum DSM 23908 = CRBIP 24.85]
MTLIEKILILLMIMATGFVTFLTIKVISTGDSNYLLIMVPIVMLLLMLIIVGGNE